ncbi:ABC transporter substrate-binding protein [Pseudosulfitobacter sp. SM2401]|uniref:ABC transporter substrate-binding protein n=1 Tax=Pseudosulfitobacter sp. SM2401 TaxID=3350098 RepID=UPI0036F31E8A
MQTAFALVAAITVNAFATGAAAQPTDYPLSLTNCGRDITIDRAPQSTITIGQSATEIIYALGLADKVVATSVWFSAVLPEFADANSRIERLADNDPSFESVVSKNPDLVAVQYEWHVGPSGIVGTHEMFADLGIATYTIPADCDTKDNTTGGDGTRTGTFTPSSIYKGIKELSAIYDVQDAGLELVASLKSREADAIEMAQNLALPDDITAAFWFSSADLQTDPYMAGRMGAPGYMMDQLGIENVVQSDEEWPTVGWETIARADPTVLVIAEMDRRRYPADNIEAKLEFLRTDPVASQMTAVRKGRVVVMDAHAMSATMRTIFGLETLAMALSTFEFGS